MGQLLKNLIKLLPNYSLLRGESGICKLKANYFISSFSHFSTLLISCISFIKLANKFFALQGIVYFYAKIVLVCYII